MARRKAPDGICHLCGKFGKLSWEHVPPESAFNDQPVIASPIDESLGRELNAPARGEVQQRGAGAYTLCERCNNTTGRWYADDFGDWCRQGADILVRTNFKPTLIYMHLIRPLRVLKQIITMAFSENNATWRLQNPELEQFVLDRERRWLDERYRVFVYFNVEGALRRVGNEMAMVNIYKPGRIIQVTEIAHPPFGYVLVTDGSEPDKRLLEITHFQRYEADDFETAWLNLPVLPTHLPIPLDYRTADEIRKQAGESEEIAKQMEAESLKKTG